MIIATVISAIASMFMLVVMLVMSESAATPNIGQHSILKLDLSGTLSERHQGMTLVQQMQGNKDQSKGLDDIVASIRYASNDDRIEGIYIDCNGMSGGIASLQYIRQTLADFKKSGKWIAAYGDAYTQGNYYIASLADSIWLNPMGAVEVTGMGGRFMFFKGLLDKLGIEMQVLKVGTYKSAVEPYVLTAPSEANIKQTREYITPIWQNVAGDIAEARGVELEVVNSWADSVLMTQNPHTFPKRNIVTGLLYRHEAESMLKEMSGIDNDDNLRFVTPVEYMKTVKPHRYGNKIALLYAEGEIVDNGENGIVGADMAPMIMDLAEKRRHRRTCAACKFPWRKRICIRTDLGGPAAVQSQRQAFLCFDGRCCRVGRLLHFMWCRQDFLSAHNHYRVYWHFWPDTQCKRLYV